MNSKDFSSIKDYVRGMVLRCTASYSMFKKDRLYMVSSQDGAHVRLKLMDETGSFCKEGNEYCYCFDEEELSQYFMVVDIRPLSEKLAISILSLFEDVLDEKNIRVPDEDRRGEEGEACLYGSTYCSLEEGIASILSEYTDL